MKNEKTNESTFCEIPGWLNPFGTTKKISVTDQAKYFDTVKEIAKAKQEDAKAQQGYSHAMEAADNNRFKALCSTNVISGSVILGFLFFACLAMKNSPANILDEPEDKYLAFSFDFIWKSLVGATVLSVLYLGLRNFIQFPSQKPAFFLQAAPPALSIEEIDGASDSSSSNLHLKKD